MTDYPYEVKGVTPRYYWAPLLGYPRFDHKLYRTVDAARGAAERHSMWQLRVVAAGTTYHSGLYIADGREGAYRAGMRSVETYMAEQNTDLSFDIYLTCMGNFR